MPRKSRVLRAANWVRVKPDGVHELVVSSDKDRYKTCHATPMILVDGPRRGRGGVATFHLQSVKFSTILRGCGCANPAELFPSSPHDPALANTPHREAGRDRRRYFETTKTHPLQVSNGT